MADKTTEKASSVLSLNSHHQNNRNSNMTMVGGASATATAVLGQSPLQSELNRQDEHHNSNSSLSYEYKDAPRVAASASADEKPVVAAAKQGAIMRFVNSELGRFLASVVYFVVICLGMAFCNQFSDHRWMDTGYQQVILEDRGFDIFPALKSNTSANIFVMTSIVFTVIGMFIICPSWKTRGIVLRRVLWVVGTLSIYRALTLSVTTLPTPKVGCHPSDDRTFWGMLWIAIQMIPGTVEACTDDIFSGHTVFMVTCAIQWRLYCKNKWVTYFSYIYITIGLYFVVATRLHYTVDVVLAIFITYAVWSVYMAMVDVVMEKEYFGHRRQRDKYLVFGQHGQEQSEVIVEQDLIEPLTANASGFQAKRAQLNARLNRMRGPGIGYDLTEHDCVAFAPMQYNTWLTGAVRWCDGLDIRMRHTGERVVANNNRQRQSSSTSSTPTASVEKQHARDGTVAPITLDSITVVSHSNTLAESSSA
ncbi:sphingomyelin synthase [Gryganskiella cystojenkinii]|nr:sphingomyelin synthase [Gryganskiella cystojenkinii]